MPVLKKIRTEPIGATSTIMNGGIVVNSEYNNELKGSRWMKVADQMRLGDATVQASLAAVKLPIQSAKWTVRAASDDKQDVEIAEFVNGELMDQGTKTWAETLNEILLYLDYGVMPFEIIWEFRADGKIGIRKLDSRWPSTVTAWELPNKQDGIVQSTMNGTFSIPMDKMIIFVNRKEGDNWWGISMLRSAYKHWFGKDKLYLIDLIASERQGLGVPIGRAPMNADEEDKDDLEDILKGMRTNEKAYGVLEEGFEIEFLDMKAGTARQIMPSIQHHDRAITLNVLAQFLMLGGTSVGSFALSSDQSKLFILSLEAIANHIKDVVNRYLIKKLVDYNFNDVKVYPTLEVEKIGSVDLNVFTTALQRAYQTGMIRPQPTDEAYIRDTMDLPEYTGEADVDLTLADGIINELQSSMAEITGGTVDPVEDPNNPGFDTEGNPMPTATDEQHASWSDDTWRTASLMFTDIYIGGPAGQPLSEETKRKISEALKKRSQSSPSKSKGKGKKAVNPEVTKRQKEITAINKQVRAASTDAKRQLLEMKAAGKKMTPEESAKFQLDLFNKVQPLRDRIDKLKDEVSAIKTPTPAPEKKASEELIETLGRVNDLIDEDEKE